MKYDLSKMLYYHGEDECPYERGVGNKPYWWTYERVFVENCEEKGLSQKRLDRQYPKHIIEMLKHVADKYGCSHWTGYLEGYLNGHAILTKYDLSGMRYYHGETKCPYEANSRESVRWGDEMEYVADCEAKDFSQERMQEGAATFCGKGVKMEGKELDLLDRIRAFECLFGLLHSRLYAVLNKLNLDWVKAGRPGELRWDDGSELQKLATPFLERTDLGTYDITVPRLRNVFESEVKNINELPEEAFKLAEWALPQFYKEHPEYRGAEYLRIDRRAHYESEARAREVSPFVQPTGKALRELAKTAAAAQIEALVKAGAKIDKADSNGLTALMYALSYNENPEAAKALIRLGANVNATDRNGTTPLMLAARHGRLTELKALIRAGAAVNFQDRYGNSALMIAATRNPSLEVLEALLKSGATVDLPDYDRRTPLMRASSQAFNPKIIRGLLLFGADVNARDPKGWTPIFYAATEASNPKIIRELLLFGADVNARDPKGWTPIFYAATEASNPKILLELLNAGADINARDKSGCTPLICAAKKNSDTAIIETLVKAGANLEDVDEKGKPAIFYALAQNCNPNIVRTFLKLGSKVNFDIFPEDYLDLLATIDPHKKAILNEVRKIARHEGMSKLMLALEMGADLRQIRKLISETQDINEVDANGRNALMWAVTENAGLNVIKALLKAGADFYQRDRDDQCALTLSVSKRLNLKLLREFLNAGASVLKRDADGTTLLMHAARHAEEPEIIRLLVKAGSELNTKNAMNMTAALFAAMINPNPEILTTLVELGAKLNPTPEYELKISTVPPESTGNPKQEGEIVVQLETKLREDAGVNPTELAEEYKPIETMVKTMQSWLPVGLLPGALLPKNFKSDPIALAAEYNPNIELIKTLKNFGLSARTPAVDALMLEFSSSKSSEATSKVKALIEVGANVNVRDMNGETPLMLAAQCTSSLDLVNALISAGAEVNARDKDGNTALIFATSYHLCTKTEQPYIAIVKALLAAGADPNAQNENSESPIFLATNQLIKPEPEIVRMLIEAGANVNVKSRLGYTALMQMVSFKPNLEIAEILIKAGANVNEKDGSNRPPLMIAIYQNSRPEFVELLLKAGADVNAATPSGETALINAAAYKPNAKIVQLLIDAGADLNHQNRRGFSALIEAVDHYVDWSIMKQLIMAGANLTLRDKRGRTALDHAEYLKGQRHARKYGTEISMLLLQEIRNSEYDNPENWTQLNAGK